MAQFMIMQSPLALPTPIPPASSVNAAFATAHLQGQAVVCLDIAHESPVLRKSWGVLLDDDAIYVFLILPQGGGKSNPLQIVLQLAMLTVGFFFGGATWAVAFMRAGLTVGMSLLANALMPKPQVPSQMQQYEAAPTYSIRGGSNQLGLGRPIPVQYGRVRAIPPMIMHPFYEYEDDDQYYHLLVSLGEGEFDIHAMRFADNALAELDNCTYQVAYNSPINLFPANTWMADEVEGADITKDWSVSAFSNPPNTTVTRLSWSTGLLRGLGRYDKNGALQTHTVGVETRYRPVDANNVATGAWLSVFDAYSAKTTSAIRRTNKLDVSVGRYEVQRRRAKYIADATYNLASLTIRHGAQKYLDVGDDAGTRLNLGISSTVSTAVSALGTQYGCYIVLGNMAATRGRRLRISANVGAYSGQSPVCAIAYACGTNASTGWQRRTVPLVQRNSVIGNVIKGMATISLEYIVPANAPTTHYFKFLGDADGEDRACLIDSMRVEVISFAPDDDSTDTAILDDVIWGDLHGSNFQHASYDNETVIAVRVMATEQLSGSAQQEFSVDATRKIPVWNGSVWQTQGSRSAVWAIADMLCNSSYGGGWNVSRLPLSDYLAMQTKLSALTYNPQFDYRFEQQVSLMEAVQTAARCIRAQAWQQGGYMRLWRDEPQSVISQLYTAVDVAEVEINYEMPPEQPVDGVMVKYIDMTTGQQRETTYLPPGSQGNNIEEVVLSGCSSRQHAAAEAKYLLEADKQRGIISFKTGLAGRIPTLGRLIAIDRDGGYIVARDGNHLALSGQVDFYDGNGVLQSTGKIQFRLRTGMPSTHIYTCVPGESAGTAGKYRSVVISDSTALPVIDALDSPLDATRYSFWVGDNSSRYYQAVVTKVERDGDAMRITGGLKADIADNGMPDDDAGKTIGKAPSAPLIKIAKALQKPAGKKIRITLSWLPVHFASRYEVHAQLDDGTDDGIDALGIGGGAGKGKWAKIHNGTGTSCWLDVFASEVVNFRLRAIGQQNGSWLYKTVIAGAAS